MRTRFFPSPLGTLTLAAFAMFTVAPARAPAEPSEPEEPAEVTSSADAQEQTVVAPPEETSPATPSLQSSSGGNVALGPEPVAAATPQSRDVFTSLPSGADKSGVTSQAISVPKGSGSVQGMGESFSAQLSTGIATFSVPFSLVPARGDAQPSLALSYSSSGGFGAAGVGWDVGVPFIARQTDRGIPRYEDTGPWHAERDRFVFNGGQELVPICVVGDPVHGCSGRLQSDQGVSEALPVWATNGWEYYRARVEGSFLRFFWSPDRLTWVVQDKSGVTMELGRPLVAAPDAGSENALERNSDAPNEIYRWHLSRQYDAYGNANPAAGPRAPVNVVVYRYEQDSGRAYLTDIFDTTPISNPTSQNLADFAHHTHLEWQLRPDPTFSYRSGWRMDQRWRLSGVEVSSKTFQGSSSEPFHRVRIYHLAYDDDFHVSLLKSVQVEGRCAGDEQNAPIEGSADSCPKLPAMEFGYSHVKPAPGDLGYEDFDETPHSLAQSPKYSLDEAQTDLFDVNSDGLPDVVVTAGGLFNGEHGLFLSGASSFVPAGNPLGLGFTQSTIAVSPLGGIDANVLKLGNSNVTPLDLDGDGRGDLVHMPVAKKYEIFSPAFEAGKWLWKGRSIDTASQQNVKIDFTNDNAKIRVLDVDFDGLVDIVATTGTELQSFLSLGRYPPASGTATSDGQFGHAEVTGPDSAQISNAPVTTCLPWSATPIQFSDPDVKLGDMNGDGITDIVRVRSGDIRYWPGRGNGFWGTGKRNDCPKGTFGQNRHIAMGTSPNYQIAQGNTLLLDDVNGDGLSDLVEVRFNAVDVYLNVNGEGWTDRHILYNTPVATQAVNRVRLVDVDGSGTRDVLWGDGYDYKYIDLQGGVRPWLLTSFANGLGKTTTIEYSTSTAQMVAAAKDGDPWSSVAPIVAHVVHSVTESDGVGGSYASEYRYRDPVYDGQQREFRGFRTTTVRKLGDSNSPTDSTRSTFLLGECLDEDPNDSVDACSVAQRWRDNGREALKGLPVVTERFDEAGTYLTTEHTAYTLRGLYLGLDGRAVRHAFASSQTTHLYDTSTAGSPGQSENEITVTRDLLYPTGPSAPVPDVTIDVPVRHASGRAKIASESTVDVFGNRLTSKARGCVGGTACATPDETLITTTIAGRPAGDPTGWLWRTTRSYVQGSAHTELRNDTSFAFNAQGDPTTTTAVLAGTASIDRFHAAGGQVGVAPGDASTNGTLTLSIQAYDSFGNPTQSVAPTGLTGNERCSLVTYDEAYAHLASSEKIYVAGCGSADPLTSGATYDRGLSAVALTIDMNSQPTSVEYDGFGRLTEMTRPRPGGGGGVTPSVLIEYFLPPDLGKPYSAVHTRTQDGADETQATYLETVSFVDGMGRARASLSEADPSAVGGDEGDWVVSERADFDAKGATRRKYLAGYASGPWQSFDWTQAPSEPYGRQRYDAFGRAVQTFDLDGTTTLTTVHHALSTDLYDAADIGPGPHQGTPATTTRDGHGRGVLAVERTHVNGSVELREIRTRFLPTGQPEVIERVRLPSNDTVLRWMRYDTLGRLVLNAEPNTTVAFDPDPNSQSATMKAWRYAYNDQSDLVATSDARGCGSSFAYDGAGRLLGEDYSPCEASHALYTEANRATLAGFEVLYRYDSVPGTPAPGREPPPNLGNAGFSRGKLLAVWDRATASWTRYDARGRVIEDFTRIAKPEVSSDFPDRYAPRWYSRSAAYDAADRAVRTTTGATVSDLLGTNNESAVTSSYSARGTIDSVGSSYGALVEHVDRSADALINELHYGDGAHTKTAFSYDNRRRLRNVQTYRGPPSIWTTPPPTYQPSPAFDAGHQPSFQFVLQDEELNYDPVNNPVEIRDWRIATEWPAGAKPVTRKLEYDDLYRVERIDYEYAEGDDDWTSPYAAENDGTAPDPRRASPSPHVPFAKRTLWQTFGYDWLGNTESSDDDARGFYDRSLGAIQNDAAKRYQLAAASNEGLALPTPGGGDRRGALTAVYDGAGNLTRLDIKRNAAGTCLPAGAHCNQRFLYQWDEVGRLVRARRWDVTEAALATPLDTNVPAAADLAYRYDASDQRVLKQATDEAGVSSHTAYVFDSLELRRASWKSATPGADPDYELTALTEVPYLFANGVRLARVAYEPGSPALDQTSKHVFLELGDHLGSTSVVLDHATGELVERSTTYAYGATESDYRPNRWQAFREDYRFTGKEEDVEVGLQYFGKRFLSPYLNRWVSADPLAIHGLGADLNVYAYVSGQALKAIDPLGLEGAHGESHPSASGMDTPMEDVGTNGGPSSFMEAQPEAIAAEQELAAQRAQVDADFARFIEARNQADYLERAAVAGQKVAIDATPALGAEAARAKAAYGLGIMTETTPLAPAVVSLQALTGNNDVGVVANHVGMIVGAGSYRLEPPRVITAPAAMEGPVGLRVPAGATSKEIEQITKYCALCNQSLAEGQLSPTGRVSTKGPLRAAASRDAALIRKAAAEAGVPFEGHVGHTPDTTWTGKPQAPYYLDLTPRLNQSLGGQASRYPLGYKPTSFILEVE